MKPIGLRPFLTWTGVTILAVLTGFQIGNPVGMLFVAFMVLAILLVSLFRDDLTGLLISIFVCESLAQIAKRAMFWVATPPIFLYHGIQALPWIAALLLLFMKMKEIWLRPHTLVGGLLGVFFLLSTGLTLLYPTDTTVYERLTSCVQSTFPILFFWIGLTFPFAAWPRLAKAMAYLAIASVLYGIVQFAIGPTPIDQAWAAQTWTHSIHGRKVFETMESGPLAPVEFRIFSFYPDPLTWGFFLLFAFTAIQSAPPGSTGPSRVRVILLLLIAFGLILTQTRTVILGLLLGIGIVFLLRYRSMQRGMFLFLLSVFGFLLVYVSVVFVYNRLFLNEVGILTDNPLLKRLTTTGTAHQRTFALEEIWRAVTEHPLIGVGYVKAQNLLGRQPESLQYQSHNVLVSMIVANGLPGVFLFLSTWLAWLAISVRSLRTLAPSSPIATALRWMIAFAVSIWFQGYLCGNAMNHYFFFVLGAVCRICDDLYARDHPDN